MGLSFESFNPLFLKKHVLFKFKSMSNYNIQLNTIFY